MGVIKLLDKEVSQLIAAGEVVERPSSVVKELVENSIDAGASKITVEIRHGGVTLIRVSDNGSGIEPDDVPMMFLRHATSKVRTQEDLSRIATLGFRGEAMASIHAVSRVEVLTRKQGTDDSYGIDVSRLAGIPEEIIQRAQQILKQLESGNMPSVKAKKQKQPEPMVLVQQIGRAHV